MSNLKKCPKCKTLMPPNAVFCPKCGLDLEERKKQITLILGAVAVIFAICIISAVIMIRGLMKQYGNSSAAVNGTEISEDNSSDSNTADGQNSDASAGQDGEVSPQSTDASSDSDTFSGSGASSGSDASSGAASSSGSDASSGSDSSSGSGTGASADQSSGNSITIDSDAAGQAREVSLTSSKAEKLSAAEQEALAQVNQIDDYAYSVRKNISRELYSKQAVRENVYYYDGNQLAAYADNEEGVMYYYGTFMCRISFTNSAGAQDLYFYDDNLICWYDQSENAHFNEDARQCSGWSDLKKHADSFREGNGEVVEDIDTTEYVFPYSNTEYLTMDDLEGLDAWHARVARNEIFARYGCKFKDDELRAYFEGCSWYHQTMDSDEFNTDYESMFNEVEIANINLIIEYENKMGYQ